MLRTRSASLFATAVACAAGLLLASGCAAPGHDEREAILFEPRIVMEPRAGVFIPTDSEFDEGAAVGYKIAYEFVKNASVAFDFTYAEVSGQSGGFSNGMDGGTPVTPSELSQLDAESLEQADRFAMTLGMDFDVPLAQGDHPPILRLGVHPGLLLVGTDLNSSLDQGFASQGINSEAKDLAMFMLRLSTGMRVPITPDLHFFVDGNYEYAEDRARVRLNGDNVHTDVLDFGGFSIFGGFSFKF